MSDTGDSTISRPRGKSILFALISLSLGVIFGLAVAEVWARMIEPAGFDTESLHTRHPVLGWVPASGRTTVRTDEYSATYDVNALGMNDRALGDSVDRARIRIVAVGDSNTFAQAVSRQDAWPKVLETMLFKGDEEAGVVYNIGVIGYSLGQYLLRLREFQPVLRPQIVVVGFSMHNDLYDLLPPRLGGFVYGETLGRVYFDLDEQGNLIEIRDLAGKDLSRDGSLRKRAVNLRIRNFLNGFALYRRYRQSDAAMWVAVHLRPSGESLWPAIDTALKKRLDQSDEFRWRLAGKILERIARETRASGAQVVLANIPYLPQVYDDVWQTSFGAQPDIYDRWIAGERLGRICEQAGIHYVDTTRAFVEAARRNHRWLHYREDRHPTAEGHLLIAQLVAAALKEKHLVSP